MGEIIQPCRTPLLTQYIFLDLPSGLVSLLLHTDSSTSQLLTFAQVPVFQLFSRLLSVCHGLLYQRPFYTQQNIPIN